MKAKEVGVIKAVVTSLESWIDAETAIVSKSTGSVQKAALARRDEYQTALRALRPLVPADDAMAAKLGGQ